MSYLHPKNIFKALWFGFGLTGLVIVSQNYLPRFLPKIQNSSLVKGVQNELAQAEPESDSSTNGQIDLTQVDPQVASQAITKVIVQEITKILKEQTEVIKTLPAKQVRKIKIGACEELLEEDICAVASEINCSTSN